MLKKYNKLILRSVLSALIITSSGVLFAANTNPTTLAQQVQPAQITPATITPGGSSSATSTSATIPNSTASDSASQKKNTKLPDGMIIKTKGKVVSLKVNKKIHPLKAKSLFFTHETILTKKDSAVALRFNDGTFVVLGPESILEIKKYHFTIPAKGKSYTGSSKDRAEIKLLRGNLKVKLGSIATVNKASAFAILTPRGRLELSDLKNNPNAELIYNNKVGLAVKAVGTLSNSKGQVTLTDKLYGLASAVVGSAPTTTNTMPLAFSDVAVISTVAFFSSEVDQINTAYSESIITEEENTMASDAADTSGDTDASSDSDLANLNSDEEGDDDGDDEEDDDEESDDDEDSDDDDDDDSDDDDDDSGDE